MFVISNTYRSMKFPGFWKKADSWSRLWRSSTSENPVETHAR